MPLSDYSDSAAGFAHIAEAQGNVTWVQYDSSTAGGVVTATQGPIRVIRVEQEPGIAPQLYFKYVKSKFSLLERMKIDGRLKRLQKAFDQAIANGQTALAEKFFVECVREVRESLMLARGIKVFIEKGDLDKHKRHIRGGHISDTQFKDFTRVIPKDVLDKKKKVEELFDGFVIYHYWNEDAEKVRAGKQKMTSVEKAKMRDPVLFGWIRETNRLYYIADWEDDYCDLTFEEMVDVIGKDEADITIPRNPVLPA